MVNKPFAIWNIDQSSSFLAHRSTGFALRGRGGEIEGTVAIRLAESAERDAFEG
jgi:hypothetical protein